MVKKSKIVTFSFNNANVKNVKLCGDFTDWDKNAITMRSAKAGEWTAIVSLTPGEHQYKFLADGKWFTDPATDYKVNNNIGSENSVRRI